MTPDDPRRAAMEELAREADRIVNLILHSDLPRVDIDIQIANFRDECLRRYPDGEALFDMVYASRFERIWKQWGGERPGGPLRDDAPGEPGGY